MDVSFTSMRFGPALATTFEWKLTYVGRYIQITSSQTYQVHTSSTRTTEGRATQTGAKAS